MDTKSNEEKNRSIRSKTKKRKRKHDNEHDAVETDKLDNGAKSDKGLTQNLSSKVKKKKRKHIEDINPPEAKTDSGIDKTKRKTEQLTKVTNTSEMENSSSENYKLSQQRKAKTKSQTSSKTRTNVTVDTKRHKSGTENKLMEKLEEMTGKPLWGSKDKDKTEVANRRKKNIFRMEDTVMPGDEDNDFDAGLDPEKAALRKKKREKRRQKKIEKQKRKQLAREKAGTGKLLAIDYLKQWDTDRDNWKFQKVRQVFLLQNMFHASLVNDESFEILLRYLEPLRGHSREATVKAAEKVIEEFENDDTNKDPVKEERARNVIQLFS